MSLLLSSLRLLRLLSAAFYHCTTESPHRPNPRTLHQSIEQAAATAISPHGRQDDCWPTVDCYAFGDILHLVDLSFTSLIAIASQLTCASKCLSSPCGYLCPRVQQHINAVQSTSRPGAAILAVTLLSQVRRSCIILAKLSIHLQCVCVCVSTCLTTKRQPMSRSTFRVIVFLSTTYFRISGRILLHRECVLL